MDIVVDMELFSNDVIKELAFATPFYSVGFSFKPPCPSSMLPVGEMQQNAWITKNVHKIDWASGHNFYPEMRDIVKYIKVGDEVTYYAKGNQKCQILSQLFGEPFSNLDNISCPGIKHLHVRDLEIACDAFPRVHQDVFFHCAQKKATVYADWLVGHKLIEDFDKVELSY